VSPPLDIAFISHTAEFGGAERSLFDLLAALDHERFRTQVILPSEGAFTRKLHEIGIPFTVCKGIAPLRRRTSIVSHAWQLCRWWHGASALGRILRNDPPTIIHANSTAAALFAFPGAGRCGVPLLWHIRDLAPLGRIGRLLASRAARTLAPSQCTAELVARVAPRATVLQIANGIDLTLFQRSAARARLPELAGHEGPLILSIGQLIPWKGFGLLLETARRVFEAHPMARFLVVGDAGPGDPTTVRADLTARANTMGLSGRLVFLGHRDDVPDLLAAADLLVHPAYPEPFGRVIVEAMASATPVVAFAGPHGPAEILDESDCGCLVRPRDARSLAGAILELLDDTRTRNAMGERGRRLAELRYDRTTMARRCAEVYLGLSNEIAQVHQ